MPEEQVSADVDQAIEALALGREPRRGILSGFASELYSALAFVSRPASTDVQRDRLARLLRWHDLLRSPHAQATAGRHFGAVHGPNVDPDRLWRHVRAAVATAAAAQAAQSAPNRDDAHAALVRCLAEAAGLLDVEGTSVTEAPAVRGSPRQLVEAACRALQDAGWDTTAARLWTIRWLEDPPEPASLARVAMVDLGKGNGLIGELRLYPLPPGGASRLIVDPASALYPIGELFLATLLEVWEQASSPHLSWSFALPLGVEAAELDGPSASGAVRVAMEVIGRDTADPSCLVLAQATQDGRLIHGNIGGLDEKLQAAKRAGITRIITGTGAPHIAEPGLKVATVDTVRKAVDFVTSREPYVRITSAFPTFQDHFGMSAQLTELSRLAQDNRILVLHGISGAGKTYLAAGLAARLAARRHVVWLEQEGMGLAEFLAEVQRAFTDDQYLSSIVGDAQIPDQQKLLRVVEALASQQVAVFVENFQRARRRELIPFFEHFLKFGGQSVIVLMDHDAPASWAGPRAIKSYPLSGFDRKDADQYLRERSPDVRWSEAQLKRVYLRTDGHALALWAICQWLAAHYPLHDILADLPKFDAAGRHELDRKLIRDVSETLKPLEFEALQRASVFRVPFDRSAWVDLEVSPDIGLELESRGRLVATASGELRIHPLVREFWYQAMTDQRPWHAAAARHYTGLASRIERKAGQLADLLEAHYHFLRAGDHASAIEVADQAVQAVHETEPVASNRLPSLSQWIMGLPQKESAAHPWLLIEQGRLFQAQGADGAARTAFVCALNSLEPASASAARCVAHYCLAKLCLTRGDARAAASELQRALSEASNDVRMQVRVLGKMVDCLTDLENYPKAEATAQELESLARDSRDRLGEALTIYRTGRINRHRGHFRDAADQFMRSAVMFAELRDDYRKSKAQARAGIVLSHLGQLKEAEESLRQAIAIKKRTGDHHGLARDIDYLADVNVLQGRYKEAEELYRESARQKSGGPGPGDIYGQIKTFNNLGRLHVLRGDLQMAEEALRKSATLIGLLPDQPLRKPVTLAPSQVRRLIGVEGTRLTNVGDLHVARGEFHEALQAYRNAAARFSAPYPLVPYSLARAELGIGVAASAIGEVSEAVLHLQGPCASPSALTFSEPAEVPSRWDGVHRPPKGALGLARDYGFEVIEALALTHISRLRALFGRIQEAEDLNSSALAIATRAGAKHVEMSCRLTDAIIAQYGIMARWLGMASRFGDVDAGPSDSGKLANQVITTYDAARIGFEELGADCDVAEAEVLRRVWQLTARLLTAYRERLGRRSSSVSGELEGLRALTAELLTTPPISGDDSFTVLVSDVSREAVRAALLRGLGVSRSLHAISPPFASQLARQVLHLWAPMAGRLGHAEFKDQIERNAFAYLFPAKLEEIVEALDLQWPTRSELLRRLVLEIHIHANYAGADKINVSDLVKNREQRQELAWLSRWDVRPRLKNPYSIFRKQQATGHPLNKILDIAGIRIITNTEEECYEALNLVRTLGEPFRGEGLLTAEVRDYISAPKPSGYQSIHVNRVFNADSPMIVEFQIRTREMHLAAEFGWEGLGLGRDPSHARYKSSPAYGQPAAGPAPPTDPASERHVTVVCKREKLRRIGEALSIFQTLDVHRVRLALIRSASDDESVVLHLYLRTRAGQPRSHMDLLLSRLNQKFSPHAERVFIDKEEAPDEIKLSSEEIARLLIELASTFPDFIYAVTPRGDIRRLRRGSTVLDFAYDIHTEIGHKATGARVNGRLVKFDHVLRSGAVVEILTSKSPQARPSRDWLSIVHTPQATAKIKQWFRRERRVAALEKGRDALLRAMRKHGLSPRARLGRDALSRAVHELGHRSVEDLYIAVGDGRISAESVVSRMSRTIIRDIREEAKISGTAKQNAAAQPVTRAVPEATGTWQRLAKCCSPVPGDDVIGYVTRGRGISVHRTDCPNITVLSAESKPLIQVYWPVVSILVEASDRPKLLRDVASAVADGDVNVLISETIVEDRVARMRFDFETASPEDLSQIFRFVRHVRGVFNVYEITR